MRRGRTPLLGLSIGLVTALAGCREHPRSVESSDLRDDLLRLELRADSVYRLPENAADLRARLTSGEGNAWDLPAARIGLVVRIVNVSDRVVRIAHPSDCYRIGLELEGPGAIPIWAPNSMHFTPPSVGTRRVLAPSESHDIALESLSVDHRVMSWRGFVTEAGAIRVRANLETLCVSEGLDLVTAASEWATITVTD